MVIVHVGGAWSALDFDTCHSRTQESVCVNTHSPVFCWKPLTIMKCTGCFVTINPCIHGGWRGAVAGSRLPRLLDVLLLGRLTSPAHTCQHLHQRLHLTADSKSSSGQRLRPRSAGKVLEPAGNQNSALPVFPAENRIDREDSTFQFEEKCPNSQIRTNESSWKYFNKGRMDLNQQETRF